MSESSTSKEGREERLLVSLRDPRHAPPRPAQASSVVGSGAAVEVLAAEDVQKSDLTKGDLEKGDLEKGDLARDGGERRQMRLRVMMGLSAEASDGAVAELAADASVAETRTVPAAAPKSAGGLTASQMLSGDFEARATSRGAGAPDEALGAGADPSSLRTLVIVDPLQLRRAILGSFLRPWATRHQLAITSVGPEAAPTEFESRRQCVMVILSLGGESIRWTEQLHRLKLINALVPDARRVVFSDRADSKEVLAAFDAGANAYIPGSLEPEVVLQALTFVLSGGDYFPPSALRPSPRGGEGDRTDDGDGGSGEAPRAPSSDDPNGLTQRQAEVLEQLSLGKSNKLIARQLGMTEATVKVHVRQIMRKLGASNRTQAALCAMESHLASADAGGGALAKNGGASSIAAATSCPAAEKTERVAPH